MVLGDGATVHIRPIVPSDADRLLRFHSRQSPESIYFRFFSPHPRLSEREVAHLTTVDFRDRMAFVALLGDEMVAVGRYEPWEKGVAETAFFVDDDHHGRGLATVLLEYLVVAAREAGYRALMATVLPDNLAMLKVFRRAGFAVRSEFADGLVEVRLGIEPSAEAEAAIAARARQAEARSVARLLRPRSVAVIGASRSTDNLGHQVVDRLLAGRFAGPVYPVNDKADVVRSIRAHRSVLDIPDAVDLALIAVPPSQLDAVVDDCARKGVGGLVVLTAGDDVDGAALATRARRHGMRLLGPASLGVVNNEPAVQLWAVPSLLVPPRGGVALAVQSATLGAAVLAEAAVSQLGVSTFVGLGDRADLDAADLLQFFEDDPAAAVIALAIESVGDARRLFAVARRVAQRKPVVALSTVGADAESGPLGPTQRLFSLALAQAGVIETATLAELFDTARLLAGWPAPRGRRVAIVGNAEGTVRLAARAASAAGLDPAVVLDLPLMVHPLDVAAAVEQALATSDSACVVSSPPIMGRAADVVEALTPVALEAGKPVVVVHLGENESEDGALPRFRFPEEAIRTLARAAAFGSRVVVSDEPIASYDPEAVATAVANAERAAPAGGPVPLELAVAMIEACGVTVIRQMWAERTDAAVAAADTIGYPVALKAAARPKVAKSLASGLALDLHAAEDVRAAHARMTAALGEGAERVLVQAMAPEGVDTLAVALDLPQLGPVVALGRGGSAGTPPGELAVHVGPMTASDARALMDEPQFGFLDGACRAAMADLAARLARLANEHPRITEVRLDPILVGAAGAVATDVVVRLSPPPGEEPPDVRRL